MLAFPVFMAAQRHGGAPSAGEGSGLSTYSRPDGVDEKDSLKGFHHAMEVQATGPQIAEFQVLVKSVDAAKTKLHEHQQMGDEKGTNQSAGAPGLDDAVENARSEAKKFLEGFSDPQKSGLREATKRLEKADSDLELEEKRFVQSAQVAAVEARDEGLDKALNEFSSQQLALGREMGIIIASGQDSTFTLPAVRSTARIGDRAVGFASAGQLSQIGVEGSQRTFKLQLTSDLSDLQQNITEILHTKLDRSDRCGERVTVQQAMLTPSMPASVLFVRLHYERWICPRLGSQSSPSEIAENNGSVELRLTPTWGKSGVEVSSQLGRIEGSAMMTDAVRQGSLGDDLRETASHLLLTSIQAGTDLKTALPLVARGAAVVQNAKFADGGAGSLIIVLEGHAQISNEQANLLASQLNQGQLNQTRSNQAQLNQATATKNSGAQ
jgi:hypothetical protein